MIDNNEMKMMKMKALCQVLRKRLGSSMIDDKEMKMKMMKMMVMEMYI